MPAGHTLQPAAPAPEKVPTGHPEHEPTFPVEKLPATQAWQLDDFWEGWNVPEAQFKHPEAPLRFWYLPAKHETQLVDLELE